MLFLVGRAARNVRARIIVTLLDYPRVVVGFVISVWPRTSVRLSVRVRLDLIFQ